MKKTLMLRLLGITLIIFMLFGCATNGTKLNGIDQMSIEEQKAAARILSRVIGQGVCAIKPEAAPPIRAVLDTIVSVNELLSGDDSDIQNIEEWVNALKRSVELVKKKSFRNNIKDLLIILQGRGVLDIDHNLIDFSEIDTGDVDVDEIMSWIRNCAGAMSEGLEDCTEE